MTPAVTVALLLVAGGAVRDVRPTTLQHHDKFVVEMAAPVLAPGAPTTVSFPALGLRFAARATSPVRAVADVDAAGVGRRVTGATPVVVEQAGRRFSSDEAFTMDFLPPTLHKLANGLAARTTRIPGWIVFALVLFGAAALVALPVPVIAGLIVVWERKISGYMQSRLGPNRVGPNGWLQWLADGIKLLLKEDVVPAEADPRLFKLSPYLAFIGLFLTFIVLPLSHYGIVADLNVGVLFLLSVTSLVVVSIIMGGWSSNSKWSLLGGMRSAAQIISYELPASLSLLTIATITGSLSTQRIVEAQGGAPWQWYLFHDPFALVAFFIWFVSALAEGNRTPFDLPEAESELVAGYFTEYSGFRFSLYPMVEWVNVFIIAAVGTMLFLGGWRLPFVSVALIERHPWLDLLGLGAFVLKSVGLIFVIIWIRWTLPRFRVDQMMNLCWKYLIPFSLVCFLGAMAWTWLVPPLARTIVSCVLFALGVAFVAWFTSRVLYNRRRYLDLALNDAIGRNNV